MNWVHLHLDQKLDVPTLAARARLGQRTFFRKFTETMGDTPAHLIESVRLDAARVLLSQGLAIKLTAARVGLCRKVCSCFERRFGFSAVEVPAVALAVGRSGTLSSPNRLTRLPGILRPMQTPLPVLYSFRRCPYAMRARLALDVSSQAVDAIEVALRDKPAEMLRASPKGTVPVLIDSDGTVIDESLDIMLWALRRSDPSSGWRQSATISQRCAR